MSNAGGRRGCDTHSSVEDKGATCIMDSTPLLKQDSSGEFQVRPHVEALTTPHSPVKPSLHSPPLPLACSIGSSRSAIQSFRSGSLFLNSPLARIQFAELDDILHNMCAFNTDRLSLMDALSPVREDLEKLKALTPERLPRYSPHLRTKSHAQILKQKLLPIGRCIVAHLDLVPEQDRGALELQLCRFIATEYWPLPVDDSTHLRIQERYRNALFKHDWRSTNNLAPDRRLSSPTSDHLFGKGSLLMES